MARDRWKEIWGTGEIEKELNVLSEKNDVMEIIPIVSSVYVSANRCHETIPGILVRYEPVDEDA